MDPPGTFERDGIPGVTETAWSGEGARAMKLRYPKLDADTSTDVAIVGGGMSGIALAYMLAKEGAIAARC